MFQLAKHRKNTFGRIEAMQKQRGKTIEYTIQLPEDFVKGNVDTDDEIAKEMIDAFSHNICHALVGCCGKEVNPEDVKKTLIERFLRK